MMERDIHHIECDFRQNPKRSQKMPPPQHTPSSASDSDSDAPETISLSQSKKNAQKRNAELHKAEALAKEQTKLKNRQRDQKLKERAAKHKGTGKGKEAAGRADEGSGDPEDSIPGDLEARMLRAMEDAEGEDSLDEDGEDEHEFADFHERPSFDGIEMDDAAVSSDVNGSDELVDEDDEVMEFQEEDSEGEEDEEMSSEEDSGQFNNTKSPPPNSSSNYLPDELFKAAFSQPSQPKPSQPLSKRAATSSKNAQGKRKHRSTPKDILVGSRSIRTLPATARPVSSRSAVPSSKINKFIDRTLSLKGQRSGAGKSWERRAANIGILRRNGPAAHFVRNR
ncbi:hypothetical protein NP233_g6452 [Leucocoprinus birnbaumii]|uniref:Uncharacterized protein n=1 Tax=Leucocoprinus birnbaumii TaxID=56174 RepID=A0AAD5VR07_9AGAR|nr:hypothetical protein NP233_g6452 [Leucocoprinus birnbaumii]